MSRNIINLALDFFQAPAEHRDLLDPGMPLPQDVSSLLDALVENKDPRSEQPVELPPDLRAAIQFMIERVFFAPGADCYRILGLNYNAGPEQIKRHYNQLLHIFALDRVDRSGEWNAGYATQINRAYSVLRDTERRLAYDQNLLRTVAGSGGRAGSAATGPVDSSRSAAKVSYLNAGIPPARLPETEPRETPAPVSRDTEVQARRTIPEGRFQETAPRSSFIANRIDRVSGASEPIEGGGPEEESFGARASSPLQSSRGEYEDYPKGIPLPAPSVEVREKRIFSMDKGTLAVLGAVVIVLIVYAVVLSNQFTGGEVPVAQPDDQPTQDSPTSLGSDSSVIREDAIAGQSGIGSAEDNPFDPANEVSTRNGGLVAEAPPRDAGASATTQAGSVGAERNAVISSVDSPEKAPVPGQSARDAQGVKATDKSRGEVVRNANRKPAAAAQDSGTLAGSAAISPASKLESMRESMQVEAPGPVVSKPVAPSATRKESAAPKPAARASLPVAAEAAPARVPAPVSGGPAVQMETAQNEPQARAGITQGQSSRNDDAISIQELDRLAETFSQAYEAGDLRLLVSLFSEDARTNDQSNRAGIESDYRDLFQLSEKRSFTFGRLRWEQDRAGGGLKGEGDFQAMVELKSDHNVTSVQGKVAFRVKRVANGIVITEMTHTYN